MSKELMIAAATGKLEEVIRLLSLPDVNINFRCLTASIGYGKSPTTPLVAAMVGGHWKVAQLLIQRGARLELPSGEYLHEQVYSNAYVYGIAPLDAYDVDTVKMMLARVQTLNPVFQGFGSPNVVCYLSKNKDKKIARVSPLFHEAILRNDVPTISEIQKFKLDPPFSLETMTQYIANRTITVKEAFAANKAIDELVQNEFILRSVGDDIKQLLSKSVKFELALDIFPAPLKTYLQQSSRSTLHELFSELLYLLFPEEKLSLYSVDSAVFKNRDTSKLSKTVEELRAWQDPVRLRMLLDMDQTILMMRFHACSSNTRDNQHRAAELLAEILLFHSADVIMVNNKEEPLLNEQQQHLFLKIIDMLYSLTNMEKLLLSLTNQQNAEISAIKQQCQQMEEKFEKSMQEEAKRTKNIESKLDRLTALLLSEKNDVEALPKRTKDGLFK